VARGARIVVVGGTGGIGGAVVSALAARGDRILATGRDPGRLAALAEGGVATHPLDLRDPGCGADLATAAADHGFDRVDGLVLAAGGLGPIGPTRAIDAGGVGDAFVEHVVGPLRVVQALAPRLDAAGSPSVVMLSGGGATGAFPRYSAYALAKVATVRLAENLAAEEPGWRVNAVAPGFVATDIHRATFAAGPAAVGPYYRETEDRLGRATPPEVAAGLIAFLLSDESAGISGRLISAPWDPWADPDARGALRGDGDFGRLRRIDDQRYFDHGPPP